MNVKKFAVVPIENPVIHIGFLDYTLSSDKLIQEACRRRDDYKKQTNYFVNKIDEQSTTIAKQASTITEQASRIAELEALLATKN